MKCEYGCNKEGRFLMTNGKLCCSSRYNKCSAVREKNRRGLKKSYQNGRRKVTWTDEHRDKSISSKKQQAIQQQLSAQSTASNSYIRKLLVEELGYNDKICSICRIEKWNDKEIKMQLDHIDGNSSNCEESNLRFLCPNCHSQTETFCGKNTNKGVKLVSDSQLIEAIKTTSNIRQALIKCGLAPKGANYTRAYKVSARLETTDVEGVKVGETGSIATPSQASKEEGVET